MFKLDSIQGTLKIGLFLSVAGAIGGALNYVFQILVGRFLPSEQFLIFSALMGVLVFLGAPSVAFGLIIVKDVSTIVAGHGGYSKIFLMYRKAIAYILGFGGVAAMLVFTYAEGLSNYLRIDGIVPVMLTCVLAVLMILTTVNNAFLQGLLYFIDLSVVNLLLPILKIGIGCGLILLYSSSVSSLLSGVMVATTVVFLVGLFRIRSAINSLSKKNICAREKVTDNVRRASTLAILLATVAIAGMSQLDVVIVNFYFPKAVAADFSAASILAKAILYIPGGIVLALFPVVSQNHARGRSSFSLFLRASTATLICCTSLAIIYLFLGDLILSLLFGEKFPGAGAILSVYCFMLVPMGLLLVAEHYLIAQGRVLFAWIFIALAPMQIIAIMIWHETIHEVAYIIGFFGLLALLVGYAVIGINVRKLQLG